jgi:hypothetical protein
MAFQTFQRLRLITKSCQPGLTIPLSRSRALTTSGLSRYCHSSSPMNEEGNQNQSQPKISTEKKNILRRRDYRFAYPEFLPDCDPKLRNHTREMLERKDMLARRQNVDMPEFYVGSIIAITTTCPDKYHAGNIVQNHFEFRIFDRLVSSRGGLVKTDTTMRR